MKKALLFLILIFSLAFIVSCNDEETPDIQTEIKVVLEYIECSNYQNEVAYLNIDYIPSSAVKVIAKYSDGTSRDVTKLSTFTCRTNMVGKSTVTVNYENKYTDYSIDVLNLKLNFIYTEITNTKLKYKTGDSFDRSGLIVNGNFENGIIYQIEQYSFYFTKDGYQKMTFTDPGIYEVHISYVYLEDIFETSYFIEVTGQPLNIKYESISIDSSKVQKQFYEEDRFNYDNLIVLGIVNSLDSNKLNPSDYEVRLFKGNLLVEDFSTSGTYKVEVNYIGTHDCQQPTATYNVTYRSENTNNKTINFIYSDSSLAGFSVRIPNDESINPTDYIRIPNEYAFVGFDNCDWNNLEDNSEVTINVIKPEAGKVIVSFLNYDYSCFEYKQLVKNVIITEPVNTPEYDENIPASFISWDYKGSMVANENRYILPIFEKHIDTVVPKITVLSKSSILVEIDNLCKNNNVTFNISIKNKKGELITSINSFSSKVVALSSDVDYILSGSYSGICNTGNLIVNLEEQSFNMNCYKKFENIDFTKTIKEVYSNIFEIYLDEYYNNCPEGYSLYGFVIRDTNGKKILEKVINPALNSISFSDLIDGQTYIYQAIYKNQSNFIIENGSSIELFGTPVYRISMIYAGEEIYAHYIERGSKLTMPFDFELPEKYANYEIAGTMTDLSIITSDLECELVLVSKTENSIYSVIFYDINGTIKKVQKVNKGENTSPPLLDDVVIINDVEYHFVGWNNDFRNIQGTTYLKPIYQVVE